jgi:hypothetical protein
MGAKPSEKYPPSPQFDRIHHINIKILPKLRRRRGECARRNWPGRPRQQQPAAKRRVAGSDLPHLAADAGRGLKAEKYFSLYLKIAIDVNIRYTTKYLAR